MGDLKETLRLPCLGSYCDEHELDDHEAHQGEATTSGTPRDMMRIELRVMSRRGMIGS